MIKLKLGVRSIIGLIILFGLIILVSWQINQRSVAPVTDLSNEQSAVNNQGESDSPTSSTSPLLAQARSTIKLPQDSEFMVSGGSATATIRFIEGSIKPLDVHVGDTQNFRIVILSTNGIKRVVAEIETDKGINEVELVREGLVGIMDTYPNPYAVNPKDNTLIILDQDQLAQARLTEQQRELAQKKDNKANAATNQREVWTGSWVVKDTHAETYFTNFIAYDSAGNQEKMTMTWSDACNIELGGDWHLNEYTATNTCAVANTVDGVDGGDVYLDIVDVTKYLNLATGATFAWNPGHTVHFDGGVLLVNANQTSQLKQAYLYVRDADHDHYMLTGALRQQTTTAATGYERRTEMVNTTTPDCADDNNDVFPGGTGLYYSTHFTNTVSSTLIYDYDCNGAHQAEKAGDSICTYTTILDNVYRYRSCTGVDDGGCCDGGGETTLLPSHKYAKVGIYDLWLNKIAQATSSGPCCDGKANLEVCTGNIITITNNDCGQTEYPNISATYSNVAGCAEPRYQYYRYTSYVVTCK
jgi:hypothetical protein